MASSSTIQTYQASLQSWIDHLPAASVGRCSVKWRHVLLRNTYMYHVMRNISKILLNEPNQSSWESKSMHILSWCSDLWLRISVSTALLCRLQSLQIETSAYVVISLCGCKFWQRLTNICKCLNHAWCFSLLKIISAVYSCSCKCVLSQRQHCSLTVVFERLNIIRNVLYCIGCQHCILYSHTLTRVSSSRAFSFWHVFTLLLWLSGTTDCLVDLSLKWSVT